MLLHQLKFKENNCLQIYQNSQKNFYFVIHHGKVIANDNSEEEFATDPRLIDFEKPKSKFDEIFRESTQRHVDFSTNEDYIFVITDHYTWIVESNEPHRTAQILNNNASAYDLIDNELIVKIGNHNIKYTVDFSKDFWSRIVLKDPVAVLTLCKQSMFKTSSESSPVSQEVKFDEDETYYSLLQSKK